MKIEEILIFKTPLDSSYSNVYDGYSTKNEYYSFLLANFETTVIYSYDIGAKRKSVNLNKKIDLQVNLNDVSARTINDYNYCCITAENGDKYFYFIDNYKINNSVGYEATLYCTWDSWSNNYLKSWENNSDKEFIETRHIDEYKFVNEVNGVRTFDTINYVTDEKEFPTISSIESDDDYEVLYVRLFCRSETTVFAFEPHSTTLDIDAILWNQKQFAGAMHSALPLKVVYSPLCVINKHTRKIDYSVKKYRVRFKVIPDTSSGYSGYVTKEFDLDYTLYQWLYTPIKNEIIYADLTFNVPYPYTILSYSSGKILYYGGDESAPLYGDFTDYFGGFIAPNTEGDIKPSGYGFTHTAYYTDDIRKFDIKINKSISNTLDDCLKLFTSKDYNDIYTHEPHLTVYPYNYYSISFGNQIVPLIGEINTSNVNCELEYVNATVSKLWFKNDNNSSYKLKPLCATSNGQVIVQVDSLAEFMQSNSQSVATQSTINAISNGISASFGALTLNAPKAITSTANAVTYAVSLDAKLKDIDNKLDSVSVPSSYSFDDMHFQDSVIILKNVIEDEKDKKNALNKFVKYGVNLNNYGNIFENTSHNFDFIKTSNCELSRLKISNYDKNIIKNMFDNGVRKWHITGYTEAVKNFDTEYINLQESLLKDYK